MKILVIQETDWIKRGPHHSHHLFERLSKLGHQIRVIDFDIDWWKDNINRKIVSGRKIVLANPKVIQDAYISVIKPRFIRVRGLDLISIGFSHFFELFRQIKEFNPDVVVSFGITCGFSSSLLCKLNNIPLCEFWLDILHELIPISLLKPVGLALEKFTLRRCDLYIAVNKRMLEYGREFKPQRSALLRAGVDLEHFSHNEKDRAEIRTQLRIKENECLLFFMGFLYKFSGLTHVIKSMTKTPQKYPKFKLLIIGDGDQKEILRNVIQQSAMENKVILLEWKPFKDIPRYISASDICLVPAENNRIMRDIVPIKIFEYLALGKPVVATTLPGIIKEFSKGNGVVYAKHPGDVVRVCNILVDKDLLNKTGRKGRKFIEKTGDWNSITTSFLDMLAGLKNDTRE